MFQKHPALLTRNKKLVVIKGVEFTPPVGGAFLPNLFLCQCRDSSLTESNLEVKETGGSHLVKVGGQVGAQFDQQVPPDLHLGQLQGFGLDVDGRERLHQELQALAAAEDVYRRNEERRSASGGRRTGSGFQTGSADHLG